MTIVNTEANNCGRPIERGTNADERSETNIQGRCSRRSQPIGKMRPNTTTTAMRAAKHPAMMSANNFTIDRSQ